MARNDDDHMPGNVTTRDTARAFRDTQGRLVPPRPNAPLLYGTDGAPRMSEAMERYLAELHERVTRPGDLPAPLALPAAWARLQAQEPRLARTLAATVMRGLSPRKAAPGLGFCFKTVSTDKGAGMAQLEVWTGLPSSEVARQLSALALLHAA